jgi:hypothetical protein
VHGGSGEEVAGVAVNRDTFEAEADRLLSAARDAGITLRLIGALAFRRRCPTYGRLQDELGREYTDIDFAGYGKEAGRIRDVFTAHGYREDAGIYVDSEGSRLVFEHPQTRLHLDVFLDKLEFSHTLWWKDRLEIDDETIPLAELVLEKMQIVQINEKDLIDTIMLLMEHPLGGTDGDVINVDLIARLCASDWGLWRTTTMNLEKTAQMAQTYAQLDAGEKHRVREQVGAIVQRIEEQPKTRKWRWRARIGDRKKWYRDVGELGTTIGEV